MGFRAEKAHPLAQTCIAAQPGPSCACRRPEWRVIARTVEPHHARMSPKTSTGGRVMFSGESLPMGARRPQAAGRKRGQVHMAKSRVLGAKARCGGDPLSAPLSCIVEIFFRPCWISRPQRVQAEGLRPAEPAQRQHEGDSSPQDQNQQPFRLRSQRRTFVDGGAQRVI